jgi:drug/metabolite transporter (DMT)-like permease
MLLVLVEFVLGPLWVWLFVNEVPRAATLVGGAIVIAAVASRAALSLRGERAVAEAAAAE